MRLQRGADRFRGDAERAGTVLVDGETHGGDALAPIVAYVHRTRLAAHDRGHLLGDLAHLPGLGSAHPEFDRIFEWRPDGKALDAAPDAGEVACQVLLEALLYRLAGL